VLSGEAALSPELLVTHIVPLPYSSRLVVGLSNELEPELSLPSDIALHSAVLVQRSHPDAKIVIVGESAYEGLLNTTDLTVERAVGEEYKVDRDSLVPLHALRSGELLNNTYRQVRAVAENVEATIYPL
jgi:hypothetical protein